MLLQALFVISAGFSHTAPRQPCASAARQQWELRSCASADADKRRFVGRRLGGRAVNKLAAKTPSKGYRWASCLWAGFTRGDVWAANDILSDDNPDVVAVRKRTKGTILGPSKLDPLERLEVSWKLPGFAKLITSVKPLDLTSRELPLPGGFTRGAVVWAADDIYLVGGEILVVKKHTKGTIIGLSNIGPSERLQVSFEHRVDSGTNDVRVYPDKLTSREPPLPGGFTRGDVVWATKDLSLQRLQGGGILAVRKHTQGSITGPSTRGLPEQLEVSWKHRVDGGTNHLGVIPDNLMSRLPPLPGGFTRGDVWATRDIYRKGGEILAVKKHTKGTILGRPKAGPAERLQVSWEHRADSGTNHLNTFPDALTSRQPPLPGGFTCGDVWAARDIYLKGGEILAVKKHTKGTIIGPAANFGASEWLTVSWEYRADRGTGTLGVIPNSLTAREPAS